MTAMNKHIILEICTGDPAGIQAAVRGGADRVELCSGLAEGGLTPSAGAIRYSTRRITTNVLIRPRAGDFVYSQAELDVMIADAETAVGAGAAGIVTGILTPEGQVDCEACRKILHKASGLENTFHRAFDVTSDPIRALEDIIDLGFSRLLTSGHNFSALAGADFIAELHRRAAGRIKIIAAAGVRPDNTSEILRRSNADEIHASARSLYRPKVFSPGSVSMGEADASDGSRMATDSDVVAAIRRTIDSLT